jgi:hypothetical protein
VTLFDSAFILEAQKLDLVVLQVPHNVRREAKR